MNDYILLMHNDAPGQRDREGDGWTAYLGRLQEVGVFQGGSSIGDGLCVRKTGDAPEITPQLAGYIKVKAESLTKARELVIGNPVFEAGGTVEIRELPRT
jgi:hypothetical protein